MYKTVTWRYGSRVVEEHDTKEEAVSFGEYGSDYGEHFFECVLDEDDVVVFDGKPNVIGSSYESEVGKKYNFN